MYAVMSHESLRGSALDGHLRSRLRLAAALGWSHLAARFSEVLCSLVLGAFHLGHYLAACFSLTNKMGPKGETTIAATSTAVSGVPHPSP